MRTALVILAFALSAPAHAADAGDGVAPLSRAFVAWRDAHVAAPQNVMSVQAPSENGSSMRTAYGRRPTGYGLVPSPLDRSGLRKFYRGGRAVRKGRKMASASLLGAPDDALDVAYNVDGKSLTPVKNQGRYGTCWAHATVGCLETDLLRSEGAQYDLSENNMVNLHGFDWPFGGGNGDLATAYLVRWRGPVLEIEDRYPNDGGSPTRLKPFRHVQKVLWIPCRENALDNATIKRAVRDFGAVYVSYYHQGEGTSGGVNPYKDSPYWKASEAAYYMGSYERSNHAVCIVGWDDNYPASRFSTRPAGDGAFLIKNSWGTDWGKSGMEGFEWISYYDATLCGHDETYASVETSYVFTSVEPTDNYDAICGYDELGALGFYGNNSQRGARWGAALFTAETDVNVAAVGIYLPEPYAEYEVYVYGGGNANEPRSGELIGSTVGEAGEYAGFQTIKVACTDKVRRGQRYSVVVKITTDSSYQLAIERPIPGYASEVTAAPGETFFSSDGSTWTDFVKVVVGESNCKFSFCCKAYLKNVVDADNSSYAVTFDANGGVGQMPDLTVRYGSPFVLPDCAFTRDGYDFQGWICEQTKAMYGVGDKISFSRGDLADDALSLCAQWSRKVNAVPVPPEITECTDGASTKVTLQWTSVPGATRYKIYCSRSDVFANAVLVDTVVGRTAYEHCCSPGYAFCYWVTAVSADGEESAPGGMRTGYRVPELEVAKGTCSFDRNGGAEEISVTANSRWRVASSDSWIDVSSAAQEETTKTLSFSVGANTDRQGRIGRIRLELLCGDADKYVQEIKVVQAGMGNPLPSRPQWKKYVYTSDGVFLEWEPSANAASYALYRKVTYPEAVVQAGEELLAKDLTDTRYVDRSATALAGAAYAYRVEAVNGTDASSSETVTVMGNLWGEAAITWSADVQAFGRDGGTANVTVSLVGAQGFDLMTSAEWLKTSVTPTGFRVTAAPNATGGKRYGSVTICCGKMQDFDGTTTYLSKATVPFTQAAGDGGSAEADDAYVATVGAGGGRGSVTVPIPARGKYVFDLSGRPYWVTRVQAPSDITGSSSHVVNWQSTGSMPFTFTCQMNVGGERIWTVPFTADGLSAGCVVIRQKAPDGSAEDRPEPQGDPAEVSGDGTMYPTLTFTANGGKGGVRLAMQPAGDKWGYDFADDWYGRPSWVSYVELDGSVVDAGTSGRTGWSSMVKTPEFAFEVAPNDTTSERSYKIAVEHYVSKDSETVDGLIGEITVRQSPGTVVRTPPEPVTGLTARTVSESAVGLQWNASSGAAFYKVLRAPLGKGDVSDFETADDSVTATGYMDEGLPSGSSFYYIVVACNGDGETPSDRVVGRTKAETPVSPTPSGGEGSKPAAPGKPYSNGLGAGSVSLAWDPAEGATTYKVLRAEGEGGAFREIAFDLTSCTYGDNFLVQNEIYRYKIVAVNAWGTTEGEEAMFSTRALRFGPGEASEFMLSATERSTVVGVSSLVWSNFAQREYRGQRNETGGSVGPFYTFDDPRIVDVEKNAVTEDSEDCASDDYWCYQFSFLDALFWGGYMNDSATEDEVADELRTAGDADGVLEVAFEGADSMCVNYVDFTQDQTGFAAELVREFGHADKLLVMGVTFDESFIWKGTAGVSHAVVCCGYSFDAAKADVTDPTILKGLFIIDSDNDMFNAGGAGGAPDSITYCPVTWNARRKIYQIRNVFGATGEVDLLGGAYVRAREAVAAENVHKTVNAAVMEEQEGESETSALVAISGKGWHEVSFAVLPEGGKPEEVFAPVAEKIGYVTCGSLNWNPLTGGTLKTLEIGKGYWVQTKAENVSWTVTGRTNPDVEIALRPGWNLIGYPLLEEGEIETVLATALATGNIRYIYFGSRVYPGMLTTMTSGKGYWVYAEAAGIIRFDVK